MAVFSVQELPKDVPCRRAKGLLRRRGTSHPHGDKAHSL